MDDLRRPPPSFGERGARLRISVARTGPTSAAQVFRATSSSPPLSLLVVLTVMVKVITPEPLRRRSCRFAPSSTAFEAYWGCAPAAFPDPIPRRQPGSERRFQ